MVIAVFCLGVGVGKAQYTVLHNFGSIVKDAKYPFFGSLAVSGNVLYGMTEKGGRYDSGAVFSIHTDGSGYKVILNFNDTNGANPYGSLILSGNVLYGMTSIGGAHGFGIVFSIHTDGTGYKDLLDFWYRDYPYGASPQGSLILSGKELYGMTNSGGGISADGVVFSIDTNGNNYKDLLNFNGNYYPIGYAAHGSLIQAGSQLFGITNLNAFSVDTNGHNYKDLVSLAGSYPWGSFTLIGDVLYGTTETNGAFGRGYIFSIDTNGSNFKDRLDFTGPNGSSPTGDLTLFGNTLYAMASYNIFSMDTNGGGFNNLYNFVPSTGDNPFGNLIVSSGIFYGMTNTGGGNNDGVVFKYQPCGVTTTQNVISNNSCHGGNTGSASVAVSGGSPPYTYLWNPGGITSTSVSGLSAGTYTITVGDNNGCTVTTFVTITEPPLLQDSIKKVNITCHGDDNGKVKVFPYGGTSPYTYLWSDGNTREGKSGLSAGTYSCTVTDNNGCSVTASETIIDPLVLSVSLSSSAVKCFGGNTGLASVSSLTGGTPPYTYLWTPPGVTTATLTGASAGTYTLTVYDKNGCNTTASVRVTQPSKIRDSITTIGCGTATVGVRGGTPSYNYHWTPSGGFTATAIVYTVGIYTVTITDRNGCTASTTADITCPKIKHDEPTSNEDFGVCCDNDIKVYPNPNNGVFTIESSVVSGQCSVEIYNVLGQQVLKEVLPHTQGNNTVRLTQPNGVYLYRIITEAGSLLKQGKVVIDK